MDGVRRMRPEDEPQIRGLFHAVFGQPMPADVWRWKYGRYGLAYVYEEDGRILSHCGALTHDLSWKGEGHPSLTVGDVMTHPSVTLRRLFPAAALELFAQHADDGRVILVFGFPAKRVFRMQARWLGVEPIAPVHILEKRLPSTVAKRPSGVSVRKAAPRHWDHSWAELESHFGLVSRRTRARLSWRYRERPDRHYRFVSVPKRPALGVVGIGGPQAHVMELLTLPGAEEDASRLLTAMGRVAAKNGATELQAWFPKPSWAAQHLAGPGGFTGTDADHYFACTRKDPRLELDWLAEHFFYSLGDWDVH